MKQILQPYNNTKEDLLFWIKEYLAFKALEFFENSSSNTVDDIISSVEKIKTSTNIDEVKSNSNLLARDGLGSMSRVINATYKLYIYTVGKVSSIKEIDTNLLQELKDWLTIGDATKKGYVDAILELCTYINRVNSEGYAFDIDESIVRVSKKSVSKKMIDVMDDEEYERFSKMLVKYNFKSEYEKARAVLMCRIFLFSGITTTELLSLEFGKSFIVNNQAILIRLENRKRDIDLPRNLLIVYFNKYKELSLKDKNYDIENAPLFSISKQYVNSIVKELLEFANIKRTPLTPQLLRYSFFVYIYNKRCAENEITFNTIHDISGIINKEELRKILNTFDRESVSIAKIFDKDKF